MAALTRFIAYDKPGFIGRAAAITDRDQSPGRELVLLEIDAADADALGGEPILLDEDYVPRAAPNLVAPGEAPAKALL